MVVVGLVVLGVAVVAAVILIGQNGAVVPVHALGGVWTGHLYWVLVAGMVLMAVAMFGLWLMKAAGNRAWRLRRERRALAAENRRLKRSSGAPSTPAPPDAGSYPDTPTR
jgi:protein-S-isoprenylcysteine O-methyltransferase Ste14